MAVDYDTRIKELEERIESARPSMEAACNEFLDATAACLAERWPRIVESAIEASTGRINEMSDDELKQLKERVNTLIANARQVVEEELIEQKPAVWPHRKALDELRAGGNPGRWTSFEPYDEKGASATRDQVRRAGGRLAQILGEAGLMVHDAVKRNGRWELRRAFKWCGPMLDATVRYSALYKNMVAAVDQLRSTVQEKAEAQAKDRWGEL